jgi:branched-chain amino acid transport system substrate-binding protein
MQHSRWILPSALLLFILPGCSSKSTPEPILVGHVAPFRGADKAIGEHAKQAIRLAVEEANKDSSLPGGRPIAVLHPDYSAGDLDSLTSIAIRLITVDRVAGLLGDTDAARARQLSRAAKDYEVPVVVAAPITGDFSDKNVFSVQTSATVKGQVLARFAASELKLERAGIAVDSRFPTGSALADAFQKAFVEKDNRQTDQWAFKSETEFADLIARVKQARAGAILFVGSAEGLGKFMSAVKGSATTNAFLFAGDDRPLPAIVEGSGPASSIYWATPYVTDPSIPQGQEFSKKYKERFHEEPDVHAALAYDALRIFLEAMRAAKSTQGAKILDALMPAEDKHFESLTGPITFDRDRSARRTLFVLRVQPGQSSIVKRFDPEGK